MKRTLLFSLLALPLFLFSSGSSKAQCAVYYSPEIGAVGYSYSNDDNGHDLNTIEIAAQKNCQDKGGLHCTLLYETRKVGWGGFIRGKDLAGNPIYIAVGHQLSEKFARGELKRKYLAADGVEYDDVLIITWRAE